MSVSRDDVRHIAALARIGVDEGRIDDLASELNGILKHMEALAEANVSAATDDDVAARGELRLRPDAGPQIPLDKPRETFAPSVREGFFVVPRLATHEETDE